MNIFDRDTLPVRTPDLRAPIIQEVCRTLGVTSSHEIFLSYFDWKIIDGVVFATHDFYTTRGIVIVQRDCVPCRWCYQDRDEATRELAALTAIEYPGGNWIKAKGVWKGRVVDDLNPNWSQA